MATSFISRARKSLGAPNTRKLKLSLILRPFGMEEQQRRAAMGDGFVHLIRCCARAPAVAAVAAVAEGGNDASSYRTSLAVIYPCPP